MITRRGFMKAILAAGVAPAVVGSGILMPVRTIWRPEYTPEVDAAIEVHLARYRVLHQYTLPEIVNCDEESWYAIVAEQMALEKEKILFNTLSGGTHNNRIREALAGGRPLPWKDVLAYSGRGKT